MWAECGNMAVQLDNSLIRSHGESNHELYYGKRVKNIERIECFWRDRSNKKVQ